MQWNSDEHTNSLIPLYAKGYGTELLKKYADETDLVRGKYIDNAELGEFVVNILK